MQYELKDTCELMQSADYKERFKAEYYQLIIRYQKLCVMLKKWNNDELDFEPTCNIGLLNLQQRVMADYIAILESRAQIEGVDL